MSGKLSNGQKRYLSGLAREVLEKQRAEARAEGCVMPCGLYISALLNDEKEFRHEQVSRACSKQGLRCCTQDDYGAVKGYLLGLLGREGQALKAMVRGDGNEKRVAEYKLSQELREGGFTRGYAEAICKNVFGCSVGEASPKQVWKVLFTVRTRSQAKKGHLTAKNAKNTKREAGILTADSADDADGRGN